MKQYLVKLLHNKWFFFSLVILFDMLVIISIYFIGTSRNIPFRDITRDPGSLTGQYFIGMLATLCLMLWSATVATCYLGAILLREIRRKSLFLFCSGSLTLILLLDDALMIHESVFPYFLNLSESLVYMVYFILFIFYFVYFLRDIVNKTDYLILISALMFFGLSILTDLIFQSGTMDMWMPLIEDGAKFVGISLWLAYFFFTVVRMVKPHIIATQTS